jgi:hypothetical protein
MRESFASGATFFLQKPVDINYLCKDLNQSISFTALHCQNIPTVQQPLFTRVVRLLQ